MESDLRAVEAEALCAHQFGEIARRHRAVELAAFGGLPQHSKTLAVELPGDLLGLAFLFQIARFQFDLHGVEARLVLLGGAQRLAFGQEVIARKPVLDAHDFAHLSELGDALEQDHFHCRISIC